MAEENIGRLCVKSNGGSLAFCKRDGAEYGRLVFFTGKFGYLMTWWDFDETLTTETVRAFINGRCVCESHATTHIIDYDVVSDAEEVVRYENGDVGYRFTMTIAGVGGWCNYRCWKFGTAWETVDANMKAEVVGTGSTVARFELLRRSNFAWTLHAIRGE